jgi:ribosome-associated protein
LATRKNGAGGSGDKGRPRMKASHEKVKAPRGVRRPPLSAVRLPARARALKKTAAPDAQPSAKNGWSIASESARETATAIAVAALDKKAVGVEVLDVAGKIDYADFLVIMTGRSDRHAQSLAQSIEDSLRSKGVRPVAIEGMSHGTWVLMDFGDVVVHVFQQEARQLYDIEGLWLDARRLPVPLSGPLE